MARLSGLLGARWRDGGLLFRTFRHGIPKRSSRIQLATSDCNNGSVHFNFLPARAGLAESPCDLRAAAFLMGGAEGAGSIILRSSTKKTKRALGQTWRMRRSNEV